MPWPENPRAQSSGAPTSVRLGSTATSSAGSADDGARERIGASRSDERLAEIPETSSRTASRSASCRSASTSSMLIRKCERNRTPVRASSSRRESWLASACARSAAYTNRRRSTGSAIPAAPERSACSRSTTRKLAVSRASMPAKMRASTGACAAPADRNPRKRTRRVAMTSNYATSSPNSPAPGAARRGEADGAGARSSHESFRRASLRTCNRQIRARSRHCFSCSRRE